MDSTSSRTGESRHRDHHDRKRHRDRDDDNGERRHRRRETEDERDPSTENHRSHREGDSEDRHHRHGHHHRSSSSRHDRDRDRDRDRHRHHHSSKRSRHSRDDDDSRRRERRKREDNPDDIAEEDPDEGEGMWVEKAATPPSTVESQPAKPPSDEPVLKRDAWMEESGIDVEYLQRGVKKPKDTSTTVKQTVKDYQLNVSSKELNAPLREGVSLDTYEPPKATGPSFTFGDDGSQWRMRKLKNVYAKAEEEKRSVDDVGAEVFGDLKSFDEVREERLELDRREMYGENRRDYKEHPTGDLYAQRKTKDTQRRRSPSPEYPQVIETASQPNPHVTKMIDQSTLNKLRASLLKAQLRGDSKAVELEAEYNLALAAFANRKEPEVVVLSAMDSRLLAGGGRSSEAKEITSGRRRGKMEANEDITLDDMVREEKRTRGQTNEGRLFAERIAKDTKFDNDLEYMDENASKLATRIQKSEIDIKNMAINDFKRQQRILDSCPLCSQEDRQPIAPVISLGTRVFLTLPTEPELSAGGAMIVPIQHRTNTLECDDDEWEEIRNFMKCLIRMYHELGQDVIFYENAAAPHRKRHAAIEAVPLPLEQGGLAPAFFKEAFLSTDEEWSQHKKIIDTGALSRKGLGKQAFRKSMVKEAPYFHVWFEIDGGMGHIVENENKWPKGDLFAREILGGMLDCELDIIKRQGRWSKGKDRREGEFRKVWTKFDWTRVLLDG
ncbi:hypothetical protein TWF696_002288 [Orbilia brochopaga]|uniref:Cell cycle control protein cwf19 n=1 Tax=Orbilia brochopaga TaxID=3140254 RepID=A0AAV9U856_9PEZI